MQLELRDVRLDLGQFPHLMPQRLGSLPESLLLQRRHSVGLKLNVVALLGGNQGSLLLLVTGLPATFLLRLAFPRLRAGVGMLRAGGQRGILRVQSNSRLRFLIRSSSESAKARTVGVVSA